MSLQTGEVMKMSQRRALGLLQTVVTNFAKKEKTFFNSLTTKNLYKVASFKEWSMFASKKKYLWKS